MSRERREQNKLTRNEREKLNDFINQTPIYDKVDPFNGRRYRQMGALKEYEPDMVFSGLSVPMSQADNVRQQFEEIERRPNHERI